MLFAQILSGIGGAVVAAVVLILTRHADRREKTADRQRAEYNERREAFEREIINRLETLTDEVNRAGRRQAGIEGVLGVVLSQFGVDSKFVYRPGRPESDE